MFRKTNLILFAFITMSVAAENAYSQAMDCYDYGNGYTRCQRGGDTVAPGGGAPVGVQVPRLRSVDSGNFDPSMMQGHPAATNFDSGSETVRSMQEQERIYNERRR